MGVEGDQQKHVAAKHTVARDQGSAGGRGCVGAEGCSTTDGDRQGGGVEQVKAARKSESEERVSELACLRASE